MRTLWEDRRRDHPTSEGSQREMTPAIDVQGLTKCYGEVVAVDRISFSVREGELFGFLGPNGAGKTTTVRILQGSSGPTAGPPLSGASPREA